MRVLVCGSRTFEDHRPIGAMLEGLLQMSMVNVEDLVIIQGEAKGADSIAGHFFDGPCVTPKGGTHAAHAYVKHERYPADWDRHGRAAGPIRNQQMLDEGQPDLVVAFVDKPLEESRGTFDMVKRSRLAGLPVWVVQI